MDIEFIKLVIAYTLVSVFIFTAIITSLSLVGIVKFANTAQQKTLFAVLIVELVAVSLGYFSKLLNFDAREVRENIVANEFETRKQAFEEKLAQATRQFESGDIGQAYLSVNELFKSDELEEYFPIKDLFILNGNISMKRQFWLEAIESYGPALKLDPNNVKVIVNAGYVQRQMENYEEAEKLYERAMATEAQNWEVLNGYYNCLRRYAAFLAEEYPKISNQKFQQAAEIVNQMKNVAADEREIRLSATAKGTLYWEWKKFDIAIVTYRQLMLDYPEIQRFKEDLAAILVETGKFDEAMELFGQLYVKERSENKVSWYVGSGYAEAAGRAMSSPTQLEEALSAGLVAISKKPDSPFSYYAVALVYKKRGDDEQAQKYIEDAESMERARDTNIHAYDRNRHMLYKSLVAEWRAQS